MFNLRCSYFLSRMSSMSTNNDWELDQIRSQESYAVTSVCTLLYARFTMITKRKVYVENAIEMNCEFRNRWKVEIIRNFMYEYWCDHKFAWTSASLNLSWHANWDSSYVMPVQNRIDSISKNNAGRVFMAERKVADRWGALWVENGRSCRESVSFLLCLLFLCWNWGCWGFFHLFFSFCVSMYWFGSPERSKAELAARQNGDAWRMKQVMVDREGNFSKRLFIEWEVLAFLFNHQGGEVQAKRTMALWLMEEDVWRTKGQVMKGQEVNRLSGHVIRDVLWCRRVSVRPCLDVDVSWNWCVDRAGFSED